MEKKIWLSAPELTVDNELFFIKKAIDENWVTTLGNNIDGFELDLEIFHNRKKKVVALNSGTSAIHLALIMLGVEQGDEVLCQSFTFCASANPILYLKANPIFVDSESDTWNMCPFFLEEAIKDRIKKRRKPKAIIVVNSYGMPAKWNELLKISKKYEIPILEDSAESLGSIYKGVKCGLFGDYSIFSFNGNKLITTSSGGALFCNTDKEKDKIIHLATQAKEGDNYLHNEVGYNYRMSNILAGIGRGQMISLEYFIRKRRENHFKYLKKIKENDYLTLMTEPNSEFISNHWLNNIVFNSSKIEIPSLVGEFNRNLIQVRRLWYPLHLQKTYSNSIFYGENLCLELYNSTLSLPSSTNLSDEDIDRVTIVLKDYFY